MKIIKQDLKIFFYFDKSWSFDWYKNDRLHRVDGPAEAWSDGIIHYHIENVIYEQDEYWKKIHANY